MDCDEVLDISYLYKNALISNPEPMVNSMIIEMFFLLCRT